MPDLDRKINEQKFISDVEAQTRFLINKGFFEPISEYQTVRNWIDQFPKDSLTPFFLLDSLIILNRAQVEAALVNILEKIKSQIYRNNPTASDSDLFSIFENHISHSVFVCACTQDNMASGAPETTRILRNVVGEQFQESSVEKICLNIVERGIEHVYIIDDFVGTGETISKQIKKTYLCEKCICGYDNNKCSIFCASKHHTEVDFTVVSVIQHVAGKEKLRQEHSKINTVTAYEIDESYSLLSENCIVVRDSEYLDRIIAEIKSVSEKNGIIDSPYSLSLSIGISGGFPNNSLALFWWAKTATWKPLVPRQH